MLSAPPLPFPGNVWYLSQQNCKAISRVASCNTRVGLCFRPLGLTTSRPPPRPAHPAPSRAALSRAQPLVLQEPPAARLLPASPQPCAPVVPRRQELPTCSGTVGSLLLGELIRGVLFSGQLEPTQGERGFQAVAGHSFIFTTFSRVVKIDAGHVFFLRVF